MLFHTWRREASILGKCESYQEKFEKVLKTSVIKDMMDCNHTWYELDEAMKDVVKRTEEFLENELDRVAPTAQQTEREDEEEGESDIFPEFAPPNTTISEYSDLPGGEA